MFIAFFFENTETVNRKEGWYIRERTFNRIHFRLKIHNVLEQGNLCANDSESPHDLQGKHNTFSFMSPHIHVNVL